MPKGWRDIKIRRSKQAMWEQGEGREEIKEKKGGGDERKNGEKTRDVNAEDEGSMTKSAKSEC